MLKKFAISALAIFLLLSCAKKEKVIKIGGVGPLTGSQSEVGQDLINGEKLAVEEINASGGLLGKKVVLVSMDDKADPKEAVSVAHKLVSDSQVIAVIGHLNSGATLPASRVYHQGGMVMLTPTSTNPKITKQGFKNVFRACITDEVQGPLCADFAIDKLSKEKFAVLHDKTAYGQGIAEQFTKKVIDREKSLLLFEGITEGDKDFTAISTKIKNLNPDLLFFGGAFPEGGLIIKQARQLGMDATFMAGDGCFAPEFMKIGGNASEGTIISFLASPWEEKESAKEFVAKFKKKYGVVKTYAPYGYECINIIAKAIKAAKKAERGALLGAMSDPNFYYEGILGNTQFDNKGDTKNKELYFYVVKEGKLQLCK
ncbi:MAG: branched-chain amino acid ABC transporter substrate-binding protein [bacterium]|nr:branched-chain amino acid ABC transporter substrate-binding protein [bacterium]